MSVVVKTQSVRNQHQIEARRFTNPFTNPYHTKRAADLCRQLTNATLCTGVDYCKGGCMARLNPRNCLWLRQRGVNTTAKIQYVYSGGNRVDIAAGIDDPQAAVKTGPSMQRTVPWCSQAPQMPMAQRMYASQLNWRGT